MNNFFNKQKNLPKNFISERIVYLISRLFQLIGHLIEHTIFYTRKDNYKESNKRTSHVGIEAGIEGWKTIFFEELFLTGKEYLGPDIKITKNIILNKKRYLLEVYRFLKDYSVTHYIYDPRTGSQNKLKASIQTVLIKILITYFNVIPIAVLTDASVRQWRYQLYLLTTNGVVFTFLDPKELGILSKGLYIIGPCLMPLSSSTLQEIEARHEFNDKKIKDLYFIGNYYKKRRELFEEVNDLADKSGIEGRIVVTDKEANLDTINYFNNLLQFPRIITTVSQPENPKYIFDRSYINQMVFRITESIACKKVAYFANVPGIEKYFLPNIDFILIEETPTRILHHLESDYIDLIKLKKISNSAFEKLRQYVEDNTFWKAIDQSLRTKIK